MWKGTEIDPVSGGGLTDLREQKGRGGVETVLSTKAEVKRADTSEADTDPTRLKGQKPREKNKDRNRAYTDGKTTQRFGHQPPD